MSQHIVLHTHTAKKWVFGWDPMLVSYFLQVHDLTRDEDDQMVVMLGADIDTRMHEVDDLVREAAKHDLDIPYRTQVELYGEKDDGR